MSCSRVKTELVMYFPPPNLATGCLVEDRGIDLTYPREIKHCVPDSPHLLFGSFPCGVATQYRSLLPRLNRDAMPPVAIINLAAVLPDGSDARELHPIARLA